MSRRRVVRLLVALVVVAAVVTGVVLGVRHVARSTQDRYCEEVEARRGELTDVLSQGTPDVLLRALPVFEDLQARAPDDIADEWQQLVSSLRRLDDALDAAGVAAATYDRDNPPAGVTDEQRRTIDTAARGVGSQQTQQAFLSLDQQARDVCGTPLTQ